MMILQVFAVEDTKAGLFNTPFFMRSLGEALRAFADLAKNKQTIVGQHPTDYRLVRLGTYNDEDASFVMHAPEPMGRADDFVDVQGVVIGKDSALPGPMTLKAVENG